MSNLNKLSKIGWLIFATVFIALTAALTVGALRPAWDAGAENAPAEVLPEFTYEINGGESGAAAFPHTFQNLAPRTAVTVHVGIEPGRYEYLLVKTVYSALRLYADGALIYECGQPGSYPSWLSDPPTLLKNVRLPASAARLRFEYVSSAHRTAMSVPELMAGSQGALYGWLFGRNSALLVVSAILLFMGLLATVSALLFGRKGEVFLFLGLFSVAAGCWGFGECNATAFLIPYPAFLYLMAFGGLYTIVIPLLRFALLVIRPRKPLPIRIASAVLSAALIAAFALQLSGVKPLHATLTAFQVLNVLGLLVFAASCLWEGVRYHSAEARQFAMPSFILLAASVLELVNYYARFTHVLSLFFLSGVAAFTLCLGAIAVQYVRREWRAADEKKRRADMFHKLSHDLRTPLTVVSTNIQTARRRPEEAGELLTNSQAEIMKMAAMISDALKDGGKGAGE